MPLSVVIAMMVLSSPLAMALAAQWRDFKDRRDAARLGAVLVPRVEDSNPLGSNIVHTVLDNFKNGYMGDHLVEYANKYGPTFNIGIFFENRTFEPEYIKSLLGVGVFNTDGEMWKFHRAMTRPFFTRERLSDFEKFDRHSQEAIRLLADRLHEGHAVNFQDLISRLTLDTATEFLFGTDVRSLSGGLPYPSTLTPPYCSHDKQESSGGFASAFVATQIRMSLRSRYGQSWPLYELFDDSVEKNMRVVHGYIEPIVQRALERAEERQRSGEKTSDPTILRDETLNILLAGRDTTASTLTSAIYALSQHPDVLACLRAEILEHIGPDRAPTFDDFRVCKYLRAVINEVLRLWPPVPFNIRRSSEPTLWPAKEPGGKPFYIPPQTKHVIQIMGLQIASNYRTFRCAYSVMLMHRRTDLWGPDAAEFDPGRFLDERLHKYLTPNPFIFLPFNAGPRICLGQQFAYNETSFFLVRLLQRFDEIALDLNAQPPASLAPWKGREKIKFKTHLTLYWEGGMWVKMKEATEAHEA
ncbi:hypothetical protein EWM64_g1746 [Hericium alpestre]|uniref:Cytochrome P450 n=1 Tax=Hericium alpestre TaxID=135208 RepID=A0A4Z0A699_9AGAM|nr:hypothetical protein EWM64_g1746 [Hericium alpestre]